MHAVLLESQAVFALLKCIEHLENDVNVCVKRKELLLDARAHTGPAQ